MVFASRPEAENGLASPNTTPKRLDRFDLFDTFDLFTPLNQPVIELE